MAYRNVHQYWVYIMSNKSRSVVYTGITNDLYRRYLEHRTGIFKGFTQRYNCCDLIYYEEFKLVEEAIEREKEDKRMASDEERTSYRHAKSRSEEFGRGTWLER